MEVNCGGFSIVQRVVLSLVEGAWCDPKEERLKLLALIKQLKKYTFQYSVSSVALAWHEGHSCRIPFDPRQLWKRSFIFWVCVQFICPDISSSYVADVNFVVEVARMQDYRGFGVGEYRTLDISTTGAPPCTAVSMKIGHARKFSACLEQWCVFLA